ncbi:hypothetical protein [Mycobacteroides abscessus]|uniref:hypothetical protein n=1 Tax=Mycobacteroides abscessus TaxID=36809 RepID=UPI0012FFF2B2|nr:hypothetical protein [Mycobacteroides abscessus]
MSLTLNTMQLYGACRQLFILEADVRRDPDNTRYLNRLKGIVEELGIDKDSQDDVLGGELAKYLDRCHYGEPVTGDVVRLFRDTLLDAHDMIERFRVMTDRRVQRVVHNLPY